MRMLRTTLLVITAFTTIAALAAPAGAAIPHGDDDPANWRTTGLGGYGWWYPEIPQWEQGECSLSSASTCEVEFGTAMTIRENGEAIATCQGTLTAEIAALGDVEVIVANMSGPPGCPQTERDLPWNAKLCSYIGNGHQNTEHWLRLPYTYLGYSHTVFATVGDSGMIAGPDWPAVAVDRIDLDDAPIFPGLTFDAALTTFVDRAIDMGAMREEDLEEPGCQWPELVS
jgi:hypothetical protein